MSGKVEEVGLFLLLMYLTLRTIKKLLRLWREASREN
jgi:hypothetical protein